MTEAGREAVWRRESPHVLVALLRRHGDLGDCEDATQEALAAAAQQWPRDGIPENPRGWLVRVASRRLIDQVRSDRARVAREEAEALAEPRDRLLSPAADDGRAAEDDDTLQLLLLCCHPALTRPSQVALTLRAVAGLTTAEIATAFLVPETTMAQRISRAKATLKDAGARFRAPTSADLPERVAAVLDVLHLVFNEGYTRSSGDALVDSALTDEAIRLTRRLRRSLPDHHEVAGALALMLLTRARSAARTDDDGDLVPLAQQDRARWDTAMMGEGARLLEEILPRGHVGRFQLQAAIAAVHAEAGRAEDTDWKQIVALYDMLEWVAPSGVVTLNRAVAVGMARGPEAGLRVLDSLSVDTKPAPRHRVHAVRAHLLEMAGDHVRAAQEFRLAARLTASLPEQRYLGAQANRAHPPTGHRLRE